MFGVFPRAVTVKPPLTEAPSHGEDKSWAGSAVTPREQRLSEIVQQVELLVTMPGDLSLIPEGHMVEGQKRPLQSALWFPHVCHSTHMYTLNVKLETFNMILNQALDLKEWG